MVDVKTRLVVDDAGAAASLKRIRQGFTDLSGARDSAQQGMTWFSQTVSTLVATQLPMLGFQLLGVGRSFMEAANRAESADHALGGLISSVQSLDWKTARSQAEGWGDTVDAITLKTMQDADDMGQAFETLVEITGATNKGLKQSRDQLEQLGTIANVLGKPTSQIAQEFAFMNEGMLKSRGAMAQLLQTTGIFGDNIKKAVAPWMQMDPDKRSELLSQALAKVSGQMAKATPTFGDYMNQIGSFAKMARERLGQGMFNATKPALERLSNFLTHSLDKVDQLAADLSTSFAKFSDEIATQVEDAFSWVVDHQDEIAADIKEAWQFAKDTVAWIIQHKDTIAKVAGLYAAGKIAGAVGSSGLGSAALGVGKAAFNAGSAGSLMGGGVAGGVASLGALALAIGGVALAADQAKKALDEGAFTSEAAKNAEAQRQYFEDLRKSTDFSQWGAEQLEHFEKTKQAFIASADAIGMTSREAGELADKADAVHRAARAQVAPFENAANGILKLQQAIAADAGGGGASAEERAAMAAGINQMSVLMNDAMTTQNSGALKYMASVLANSQSLRDTFTNSALMTEEGFNKLADVVETMGPQFADFVGQLRDRAKGEATLTAGKVPQSIVNFNGGQTFKINQDFRDQDPDRVAIVFQRDILAAATRRLQASTTSPFGT